METGLSAAQVQQKLFKLPSALVRVAILISLFSVGTWFSFLLVVVAVVFVAVVVMSETMKGRRVWMMTMMAMMTVTYRP